MALYRHHPALPSSLILGLAPHRLTRSRRHDPPPIVPSWRRTDAALIAQVDRALVRLHDGGRRSVFLVDIACGDGRLLVHAARRARALGFVAIDGRGFDAHAEQIACADLAARNCADPAIGLAFEIRAPDAPLPIGDEEADIVIAAGPSAALSRLIGRDGAVIAR